MSATMTPPPRPMPPMAPPGGSPIAGATQGMAAPGQNPMLAKLLEVVQTSTQIVQVMSRLPGVDREKLQQAAMTLRQGFLMLVSAVPTGGGGMPQPGGAAPPGSPPGIPTGAPPGVPSR